MMRTVLAAALLLICVALSRADDEQAVPGWEGPPEEQTETPRDEPVQDTPPEAPEGQPPGEGQSERPQGGSPSGGGLFEGWTWGPDGAAGGSGSTQSPEQKKAAATKRAAANKKAQKLAQSLKSMTRDASAADRSFGSAADKLARTGAPAGAAKSAAVPSDPRGPAPAAKSAAPSAPQPGAGELSSWFGAYSSLAASRGLTAYRGADGRLSFRRRDGSPATEKEIADLKQAASREPGAVGKYPEFFSVLPRERYEQLRGELATHPGRPDFKDVGMSADERRDIVWTRSCAKVSGDCNPAAEEQTYKKDEFVKPKTAKNLWTNIFGLMDEAGKEAEGRDDGRLPELQARGLAASASAESAGAAGPEGRAGSARPGPPGSVAAAETAQDGGPGAWYERGAPARQRAGSGAASPERGQPGRRGRSGSGLFAWALGLAGAAAVFGFWLKNGRGD